MWNIIRFNWHFYLLALGLLAALMLVKVGAPVRLAGYCNAALLLVAAPLLVSLAASFYVYDVSNLYKLAWVPPAATWPHTPTILNVNAGFDEASALLQRKFRPCHLLAFDFYDPARHSEVSIRRAQRAYPPFPGTLPISTHTLPLPTHAVDGTFAFLAAHEIRDPAERIAFFRELSRVTKPTGCIIVTEHLRDAANFLAYNVGFLHFHARATWLATFQAAGLVLESEVKVTPFISVFTLSNYGAAY